MHRDSADALNRALDDLAAGLPASGDDIDPELLATAQWLDDLGRQTTPDPAFVGRLEQELRRQASPATPEAPSPEPRMTRRRRLARLRSVPAPTSTTPRSGRAWGSRAVAWGSWVVPIALVAVAVFGALRFLPDRASTDPPAVAPGFHIDPALLAEMAAHPIVGAWTVDPYPGRPVRVVFHADGTYIEVDPLQGTGVGVWRPTGERSGEVVVEWQNRNEPGRLATDSAETDGIGNPAGRPLEYLEGRSTLRSSFAVSEDSAGFTGTYHLQQFLTDGALVPEEARGEQTGTRLGFDAPADAASIDPAARPIVGAWTLEGETGPPSVAAFYADGTYMEVNPLQGTGVGVWRATDARSGEVLVEWPNRSESGRRQAAMLVEGYVEGWTTLQSTFTLDEDGMSYTGTYEATRFYPGGVEFHVEDPGEIAGTRIVLDGADVTGGDAAAHPALGGWISDTDPPGEAPRSLEILHRDGTVLVATSTGGAGIGVWQSTDEHSGVLVARFESRASPYEEDVGVTTLRREDFTVAEDATSYSGSVQIQELLPDGTPAAAEVRAATVGTRLTIESGLAERNLIEPFPR